MISNKNEYFCPTFYEMYKMENKENKVNKDIVRFLLTYKWTDAYTAYGSKKNPDPRDGFYKHICVGVDKDKDEEADDQSDQRFAKQFGKHLQDALADPQVREKRAQYKQMGKENPKLYYEMMTSLQQVLKTHGEGGRTGSRSRSNFKLLRLGSNLGKVILHTGESEKHKEKEVNRGQRSGHQSSLFYSSKIAPKPRTAKYG